MRNDLALASMVFDDMAVYVKLLHAVDTKLTCVRDEKLWTKKPAVG